MIRTNPLCIDLFCGLGGWAEGFLAEGYRVVGFDNCRRFAKVYPGEFVLQDVRTLDGRRFRGARCIVASPPCQQFSNARWANRKHHWKARWRLADMSAVNAVDRIRRESGVPTVLENVAGLRPYYGPWKARYEHHAVWGDIPTILPTARPGRVWHGPKDAALRAKIPLPLARAVARGFL